jgi:hypothetical protein
MYMYTAQFVYFPFQLTRNIVDQLQDVEFVKRVCLDILVSNEELSWKEVEEDVLPFLDFIDLAQVCDFRFSLFAFAFCFRFLLSLFAFAFCFRFLLFSFCFNEELSWKWLPFFGYYWRRFVFFLIAFFKLPFSNIVFFCINVVLKLLELLEAKCGHRCKEERFRDLKNLLAAGNITNNISTSLGGSSH